MADDTPPQIQMPMPPVGQQPNLGPNPQQQLSSLPQQDTSDPFAQQKQFYQQQIQQNTPVDKNGVKGLLSNFFQGMGSSMMRQAGLPTPYDKVQQAQQGLDRIQQMQSTLGLQHQQLMNAAQEYAERQRKPAPPGIPGITPGTPITNAENFQAQLQQQRNVMAQGPTVNLPQNVQDALGLGPTASLKTANMAQGIVQKQEGQVPITNDIRSMLHLPASVQTLPATSLTRALGMMAPQTRSSFEWKETSPGVWEPLPTKATTTRGFAPTSTPSAPAVPGFKPQSGVPSAPTRPGMPGKVYGGGSIYAYDPKTNETVMTTPTEAQSQGFTNPRKVTQKNIEDDRQLNNRLYDVATKIQRYDDSINTPITDAERGNIAGLLSSDKLKVGAFGAELPVDRLNQLVDSENMQGLSQAARNRLIAYYNARESMMGYTRVLTGSGRSNESNLNLNLQALPSPVMPEGAVKQGIQQFHENIGIAGQGLPRQPGIKRAQDVLGSLTPYQSPTSQAAPANASTTHLAGGQAQGLPEGKTGTGSDGKKYVVRGGTWVAQ